MAEIRHRMGRKTATAPPRRSAPARATPQPEERGMTRHEAIAALTAAGVDPSILEWVQNGQAATRWERLEAGEITIADIIAEEEV
jgi:hypothetical protein